jgi:hypothetical protein
MVDRFYYSQTAFNGRRKIAPIISLSETGKKLPCYFTVTAKFDVKAIPPIPPLPLDSEEKVASHTVPRAQLRLLYTNPPDFLLPFDELVSVIKTGASANSNIRGTALRLFSRYAKKELETSVFCGAERMHVSTFSDATTREQVHIEKDKPFDLGFALDPSLSELPHSEITEKYGIVAALIFRVYCAHYEMNKLSSKPQCFLIRPKNQRELKEIKFIFQLFIDTHIGLCGAISRHGILVDSDLMSIMKNPESITWSIYNQFYPRDVYYTYYGDFPDISNLIYSGSIWYNTVPKANFHTILDALVHLICCKTQLFRNSKRSFA